MDSEYTFLPVSLGLKTKIKEKFEVRLMVGCDHRIIEYPELEGTLKDHQVQLLTPHRSIQVQGDETKCTVQSLLKFSQARCSDHFPGEPVPVCNHPLCEEPPPDVKPKFPLPQLI